MKAPVSDLGLPMQWRGFFLMPLVLYTNPYVVSDDERTGHPGYRLTPREMRHHHTRKAQL